MEEKRGMDKGEWGGSKSRKNGKGNGSSCPQDHGKF